MMTTWVSFSLLLLMIAGCAGICLADHYRRRPVPSGQPLTFLVPCYNDGDTIRATIRSLFDSYATDCMEVLVANDASTDGSGAVLDQLAREYPIRVFHNPRNLGKAETLNRLSREARHGILVFMDADTILHPRALQDLLARLADNPRLGAVSCPYQPLNKGVLPRMQSIEYSMMTIVQGAYNPFSTLALWGGCIAVRKAAFEAAGRFSISAITEDVDLAHKLTRCGWKVQQSLVPVRSLVPDTLKGWVKQKMRWTSGGFQCLVKHPDVWMRNPLHVVLVSCYSLLSVNCAIALGRQTLVLDRMWDMLNFLNDYLSLRQIIPIMNNLYTPLLVDNLMLSLCFSLLSIIYVIPLITRWRDTAKLLLIIPFSLAYFPLYTLVSAAGFGYFVLHFRRLTLDDRGW